MSRSPFARALTFSTLALCLAATAAQEHKHDANEKHKLGRKEIAGYTVSVILVGSELDRAGETAKFDIALRKAKTSPKALRVWVGTQDAAGSTKVEGTKGANSYTGSLTAPTPYPEGSKLWVEIETDKGTSSGSFALDAHDHKH